MLFMIKQTHTYTLLELSDQAYDEIAIKLRDAGYDHAFTKNGEIDMHGIGVVRTPDTSEIKGLRCNCVGPTGHSGYIGNPYDGFSGCGFSGVSGYSGYRESPKK